MSRPTGSDLDAELALLTQAALAAGDVAMRHFRNNVDIFWKNGGTSPVTAADLAANEEIARILRTARPSYGWLSEESEDDADRLTRERVFVIDPIDGTRAFMHGKDTWCVSVAVVQAGRPIAGVLVAPALGETWQATAYGLVRRNGVDLVSPERPADKWVVSGADDLFARMGDDFAERVNRVKTVPSLAYRVAMVADGRLDATLVKPHAHDWDLAAAELILNNAGGKIVDERGNAIRYNLPTPRHGRLCAVSISRAQAIAEEFVAIWQGQADLPLP